VIALVLIAVGVALIVCAVVSARNHRAGRYVRSVALPPRATMVRSPVREDVPHLLYVYVWKVGGGPAYFGISNEPDVRDRRHARDPQDQWWYAHTTKVMHEVAWYPNRAVARAAERAAVRENALRGARLANDHHNPNPIRGRARV